ncbi:hypothetical protein [Nitrosomonas aestuarii]|uniref:hypothetical protein n=1 Tax=Nitrosomonas aestuarii TaxID=52441 RepID=UPI000D307E15|nr:hypothetical protein [Nitrosomonas aestuarii]PTN12495.1 hypothetical protein C8R11_10363 [Nitrosomonas aestuarii]
MYKNTLLFCTILIMWLLAAQAASARNLVVAVSPYYTPDEARRHSITLLQQLTELNQGSRVTLLDGYNLSIIGEFNIPDNPAYNNPKARLGVNRKAATALKRFADQSVAPGGKGHPSISGAVRLPQLLRYVANNFERDGGLDVIILGSPLYDDPREPVFSMAGGRFPSDGHLFASQGKTPFGAAGHSGLLKNVIVHIGYGSDNIMQGDRHAYFVKRFWTLYAELLGGKLGGFVGDVPTVFRSVSSNAAPPAHAFKPVKSNKLEMVILPPVESRQSIFERPVSETVLAQAQIRRAENVQIGISWQCALCDLDLYAQAMPGAPVLYFGRIVTPHGRYWKDYRNSPGPTNGYETIGFDVPLDLRTLTIAINFYEGQAPQGVSGELRLSIDGHTYASTFHIAATTGNQGKGALEAIESGHANQPQSIIINPLRVVGLQ